MNLEDLKTIKIIGEGRNLKKNIISNIKGSLVTEYTFGHCVLYSILHRLGGRRALVCGSITSCKDILANEYLRTRISGNNGGSLNPTILFLKRSVASEDATFTNLMFNGFAFLSKVEELLGMPKSAMYKITVQESMKQMLGTFMKNTFCVTFNRRWGKSLPMFHLALCLIRLGSYAKIDLDSCTSLDVLLKMRVENKTLTKTSDHKTLFFPNCSNDMALLDRKRADIVKFLENHVQVHSNLKSEDLFRGANANKGIKSLLESNIATFRPIKLRKNLDALRH